MNLSFPLRGDFLSLVLACPGDIYHISCMSSVGD